MRFLQELHSVLRIGWLAPASYVLQCMKDGDLSPLEVGKCPTPILRKWFKELDPLSQAEWVNLMRVAFGNLQKLSNCLGVTRRRLEQIARLAHLPSDLRADVANGKLSERAVRARF